MNKSTDKEKIVSPCISICRTDPRTGYCYGCARTDEEKIIWKEKETSIKWKKENIYILTQRMSGWQLETFKESYECKVKTGISIFKKNQFNK
tara:strand:+ start:302 stop:577 length:276 start_codon:yes stop_codon:yes gene_type:complete